MLATAVRSATDTKQSLFNDNHQSHVLVAFTERGNPLALEAVKRLAKIHSAFIHVKSNPIALLSYRRSDEGESL